MIAGIGDQASGNRDMRWLVCSVALLISASTAGASFDAGETGGLALAQDKQTPRLSNGRIESHTTTNIAKDIPALAATLSEPTWIGYTQPMIDGDRNMCDYWNDGRMVTQSTDPIRLEPADFFFVMFRVEDKQITRIRTYSSNCPLDAGGKAVHWFSNVSVADSVGYMKTFMTPNATKKMNDSAVTNC
jgi:hypothetical protein